MIFTIVSSLEIGLHCISMLLLSSNDIFIFCSQHNLDHYYKRNTLFYVSMHAPYKVMDRDLDLKSK